jgi:hypothetical protein
MIHFAAQLPPLTIICPLLRLPLEIRLVIYNFVFTSSVVSSLDVSKRTTDGSWDRTQSQHYLLLTCRQIYVDAQQLFYSVNLWNINHEDTCRFLIQRTIYQQAVWIKELRLHDLDDLVHLHVCELPSLEALTVIAPCDRSFKLHLLIPSKDHDEQWIFDQCRSRLAPLLSETRKVYETLARKEGFTFVVYFNFLVSKFIDNE